MAEALTRVADDFSSARAEAMVCVPSTREAKISCLYAGVQRWSPTPAPARCTTVVTPSRPPGSRIRCRGSQAISALVRGSRRTRCSTSSPRSLRNADSAPPISPDAPEMATRCGMPRSLSEAEGGLEGPLLDTGLHRGEEAGRVGTVDDAVVVGQRQVHHRADGDGLAAVGVGHDHRPLDDCPGAEDADLRLVDDRRVEQRAAAAGVGQREGAATELVRRDLVGAGALREVGDAPRQAGDVEVAGVLDHRDEEALLGVDGDAEVLLA